MGDLEIVHYPGLYDQTQDGDIDGLAVAGPFGSVCCGEALGPSSPSTVFLAAVNAIEVRDAPGRGLVSAFG